MNSLWSILVTSCCQLSDKNWYNSWQFNRVKDFCSLFLLLASISKVTVSLLPCLLSKEFLYLPSLNNDWMKNVSTIFLTCTSTKTWLMSWILKYWNLKSFWACVAGWRSFGPPPARLPVLQVWWAVVLSQHCLARATLIVVCGHTRLVGPPLWSPQ